MYNSMTDGKYYGKSNNKNPLNQDKMIGKQNYDYQQLFDVLLNRGQETFSYQHKGSSYYFPQDTKPTKGNETVWDIIKRDKMPESSGENYPAKGEVDLMKYYNNDRIKDKSRTIAAEKDVLGLIWLTKIKVK